ncbi:MAG: DUF374 domain-containing protein [Candidatus Sabulitectum sp.]|nr:DUF374 domain-containing protein [Candidatus Sabulitectum sp.]
MKAETTGTAGRILLSILGRTWRVSRLRPSTGIRGNSVLYAFWHGEQLPLIFTHRGMGIQILISRSRDGSLVSAICEKMGFKTVRGSSSRGGASAARQLVGALRKGNAVAITPDGPKGPPEIVKKGVSLISKRAEVPVVPYGVCAFPAVRLKSWDSFMIPLPFAKLVISEGKPVPPEHCDQETLTAAVRSESSRAQLLASPIASLTISIIKAAAWILTPLAELILLFRPAEERKERRGLVPGNPGRPVWLHGSSLGELKGLLPVIDSLKSANTPLFITCSTPAAREFIEKENLQGAYQPIDTQTAVGRFLDRLQPKALILAETEFWPVLLHETVSRGITAGMVNARLSEKSAGRYRMIRPLFSKIFSCFRGILTRSQGDSDRFLELGVQTEVAGDGKAAVKPQEPDPLWKAKIKPGPRGIIVAGSTREGEEETILEIARLTGLTPVLVPRHENRVKEVVRIAEKAGFKPDLWTDNPTESKCLIVNVRGILSSLYGLADIAFVGGTIAPVGGHNILEPLAHNVPVIVGPEHHHFTDVVAKASKDNICRVFTTVDQGAAVALELLASNGKTRSNEAEFSTGIFQSRMKVLLKKMEIFT